MPLVVMCADCGWIDHTLHEDAEPLWTPSHCEGCGSPEMRHWEMGWDEYEQMTGEHADDNEDNEEALEEAEPDGTEEVTDGDDKATADEDRPFTSATCAECGDPLENEESVFCIPCGVDFDIGNTPQGESEPDGYEEKEFHGETDW